MNRICQSLNSVLSREKKIVDVKCLITLLLIIKSNFNLTMAASLHLSGETSCMHVNVKSNCTTECLAHISGTVGETKL